MNNEDTARKRTAISATTEKRPSKQRKLSLYKHENWKLMHAKRLTESVTDANNYEWNNNERKYAIWKTKEGN